MEDWKFWLPFIVNVICMWLAYKQTRIMMTQQNASPRFAWLRSYWPVIICLALAAVVWIPYKVGVGSGKQVINNLVLRWGEGGDQFCTIAISGKSLMKFSDKYGVAFSCRLQNMDIDKYEDKRITISNVFSIRPEVIEMSAQYRKEMTDEIAMLKKTQERVEIALNYQVLLLPKRTNTDDIRKLSDVERYGGKIVKHRDLQE